LLGAAVAAGAVEEVDPAFGPGGEAFAAASLLALAEGGAAGLVAGGDGGAGAGLELDLAGFGGAGGEAGGDQAGVDEAGVVGALEAA
jgi:hypothetical protein